MPDLGLAEFILPTVASALGIFGTGAAAAAPYVAGALGTGLVGGGLSAGVAALTGGKPLKAFGQGAGIGAGIGGLGPLAASTLGLGSTASMALGGAAGGGLEALATGQKPLQGALHGGLAGGIAGLAGQGLPSSFNAGAGAGSAGSGAGGAAPGGGLSAASGGLGGGGGVDVSPLPDITPSTTGLGGASSGLEGAAMSALPAAADIAPEVAVTPQVMGSNPGGFLGAGGAATGSGGLADSAMRGLGMDTSSGIGKVLSDNSNMIIPGLGLAYSASQSGGYPAAGALDAQAAQMSEQGSQLSQYMSTGTLPPGAQEAVNQGVQAAEAATRSKFASMGLSGSTMESTELAGIKERARSQVFSMASQLLETGLKESGLSSQIYNYLLQNQQQENAQLSQAIANFAATTAGGNMGGLTVNLGR